MPTISVLIPVYNREDTIKDCIQSVLDQTYDDFEIIIVDNNSQDGTYAICKNFATHEPRIKIFKNDKNIGPVLNWKRCLNFAAGRYSKFLFSDDLLMPTCLEEMIHILSNNSKLSFVYSSTLIGKNIQNSLIHYGIGDNQKISLNYYVKMLTKGLAPVSPGAALIRTKDLEKNLRANFPTVLKHDFEKHGAGPDILSLLLTAQDYPSIFYIQNPLVFFRSHPTSLTIENKGGQIQLAYQSALSYFIKNNMGYFPWVRYIAFIWLQAVFSKRKYISLTDFIKYREGTNSVVDHFAVVTVAAVLSIVESTKRTYHLVNKKF